MLPTSKFKLFEATVRLATKLSINYAFFQLFWLQFAFWCYYLMLGVSVYVAQRNPTSETQTGNINLGWLSYKMWREKWNFFRAAQQLQARKYGQKCLHNNRRLHLKYCKSRFGSVKVDVRFYKSADRSDFVACLSDCVHTLLHNAVKHSTACFEKGLDMSLRMCEVDYRVTVQQIRQGDMRYDLQHHFIRCLQTHCFSFS